MFNFRNYKGMDESFISFLQAHKGEWDIPSNIEYLAGNDQVYTAFGSDISKSYTDDILIALKNTRVMIYNGQDDVVVNTAGVLQYVNSLNWEGIGFWKRSEKRIWTMSEKVKGWVKTYGNLWFVLVNGAGHMVPSDKPKESFNMLGHFLRNHNDWKE